MQEHRKSERKKVIAFTPVYDGHKNLLGYLGNLSVEGAMVIGEKPLDVGTPVTLAFDFPETPEFPARRVKIPTRVIWSNPEETTGYCNSGFEFQEIDEQSKAAIVAILERYQFRRPTSRS